MLPSTSSSPRKLSRGRTVVLPSPNDPLDLSREESLRITPSNKISARQEISKSLPPTAKEGNAEILAPVVNAFKDLDDVVSNLNANIVDIVKKQNKGFIQTYKQDIYLHRKGLQQLQTKYQESIAKVNKDEKVMELESEASFLRDEAIKLNKILEEREEQIKGLKQQVSSLKDENIVLASYVKQKLKKGFQEKAEMEKESGGDTTPKLWRPAHVRTASSKGGRDRYSKENSRTFVTGLTGGRTDHSRTFTAYEVMETEVDLPPKTKGEEVERFIDSLQEKSWNNKLVFLKETEKFCKEIVAFYERKLQDVQKEFMKKKTKIEGMTHWKLGESREMFDFFHQCLEDVRKNIAQRKALARTNLRSAMGRTRQGSDFKENFSNTTYEDFLLADKQKTLELFVSHPQIVEVIRYVLFPIKDKVDLPNVLKNCLPKVHNPVASDFTSTRMSFMDKNNENISHETSGFLLDGKVSQGPSRPKSSIGGNAELVKWAKGELDEIVVPHPETKLLNIKFAQILDTKAGAMYQPPKDRALVRNICNSYKM